MTSKFAMWLHLPLQPTSGMKEGRKKKEERRGRTNLVLENTLDAHFLQRDKVRKKTDGIKESQSISTWGSISLQWLMKRAPLLFPHTRVPFAAACKDTLLYQLVFAWVNRVWALLFFHRLLLFVPPKVFFFSLSLSLTSLPHSPLFLPLYLNLFSLSFLHLKPQLKWSGSWLGGHRPQRPPRVPYAALFFLCFFSPLRNI